MRGRKDKELRSYGVKEFFASKASQAPSEDKWGRDLIKKERNVLTTDYLTTDYLTAAYLATEKYKSRKK